MRIIATNIYTGERKEFNSIRGAAAILGCAHSNIQAQLKGKRKSVAGFTFERLNEKSDKKGRKKGDGIVKGEWRRARDGRYHCFLTDDRDKYKIKQGMWDDRGVLTVEYNMYVPMIDGKAPNLGNTQKHLKSVFTSMFGRCIVANEGFVSRHKNGQYFLYTQLTALSKNPPSQNTLKHIQIEIENGVVY